VDQGAGAGQLTATAPSLVLVSVDDPSTNLRWPWPFGLPSTRVVTRLRVRITVTAEPLMVVRSNTSPLAPRRCPYGQPVSPGYLAPLDEQHAATTMHANPTCADGVWNVAVAEVQVALRWTDRGSGSGGCWAAFVARGCRSERRRGGRASAPVALPGHETDDEQNQ